MAENQPAWRSGANTAQAERIIKGVESLVRARVPREERSVHISTGLSGLVESLKAEATKKNSMETEGTEKVSKWPQKAGVIKKQIERGREKEMNRISKLMEAKR